MFLLKVKWITEKDAANLLGCKPQTLEKDVNQSNWLLDIPVAEYFKTLELIHAIALVKCGNRKDAEILYNNLRPSQFYFLNRKFNTILYLMLGNFFNKRNKKSDEQLEELIRDTGFIRLKSLC